MSERFPSTGPARAEVLVDLDAIRDNAAALKWRIAGRLLMAVVKADGYGHGLVPAARAARAGGADWLGTAFCDEALQLRAAGDVGPILTWLAVPGEDYRPAITAGIDLTAYTVAELDEICTAADEVQLPARVQLKVDTGLSRGGSPLSSWPELAAAAAAAERRGRVRVTGVWSHLACGDEPEHSANDAQEEAFRAALEVTAAAGIEPEVTHLGNSAAAVTRPSAWFDMLRCGLAVYGLSPVPTKYTPAELGLRPAMTVSARIALVKRVPPGTGVSYGHAYLTGRETTLGVVPVGYGDGVPRHASGTAPVLAAGRVRTVAGRVCMDQFVVDLGNDPVAAGDPVVLFGPGEPGAPTAQEWAEACGTISYEIVSRVGGRMTRRYRGAQAAVS